MRVTRGRPNDPRFAELYGLNNTGQTGGTADADIDAPEGWDAAGLGAFPATGGVKVGIVDTGIRATHEDLAGKIVDCAQSQGLTRSSAAPIQEGSCADDNGHGTHVAGTIAANANNGVGVTGVAFNSPLAICKALSGPLGQGSTSDVANCIVTWADKGARGHLDEPRRRRLDDAAQRRHLRLRGGAGALIVAAAGNDGDATLNYPAAYAEVVSVAATDNRDARASFSNANADVEIAAPGVNVLSSYNSSDASYTTLSGTSMATPHVSGVAAVICDAQPGADGRPGALEARRLGRRPRGRRPRHAFGFGRVNLVKAGS